MSTSAWGAPERDLETAEGCDNPDCDECVATTRVLDAGAAVIARHAGFDLAMVDDDHVVSHYRVIAGEVMSAMSDALVDTGLARPIE